jgi:putative restriction endonuclease
MKMGIEREFGRYGAKLANRMWAVSALTDEPRQMVVSIWQHNIDASDGRWVYDDSLSRWHGAGKNLLKEHLLLAYREGLPLRAVVATQHNRAEVSTNPDKKPRNSFQARADWIGRVEQLEGDYFVLVFEHVSQAAQKAPTAAKYWRVAEAMEAMAGGTLAQVREWMEVHYPADPISDLRANLELLTVNSPSRPHYNYARNNWLSDRGHPHDRLFKVVDAGPPRRTHYVPFNPAVHGHVDLQKTANGTWQVVPLAFNAQSQAEAQGQAEAFAANPPLDSDHDARVWTMRAVAQRRGQPLFRAQLLDAYGSRCAISGCTAIEVLEAAHVLPYRGEQTNRVDNGLLLRADLHTLFDCLLLWITPELTVALAPSLHSGDYSELVGKPLNLPASAGDHPNPAHLAEHALRCQARFDR